MTRLWTIPVFVVLTLGAAQPLHAQSLAEIARQEAARRRTASPAGKVLTNGDLKAVPPPSTPAPAAGASSPDSAKADGPKPDAVKSDPTKTEAAKVADGTKPAGDDKKSDDKKDEAYWRKRVASARDAVARAQTFQDALTARINALSTDFINRDDPAQRNQIAIDRQKALAELDRVKKELAAAQAEQVTIADDARRAGVPAGWVR